MYILLIVLLSLILLIFYVVIHPVFGGKPKGELLHRIKSLSNYHKNSIENLSQTPAFADGVNILTLIIRLIKGNANATPNTIIPHLNPDFNSSQKLKITWFGHSSYLLQLGDKNILVDPVFSERTSPFQFFGSKNFSGTNFIKIKELPALDLIIITHDHYDHLDYNSILSLKHKTTHFVTSLGVGAHLKKWGIPDNQFNELAWGENYSPWKDFSLIATPARHFSGRRFKRNQTLWSSFVLKTGQYSLFLGGDSGYDDHFKNIGDVHGPFDLAILECGQYNEMWPLIHMFPFQVLKASLDLNAKILLPVHWGKFKLALHNWDQPIKELVKLAKERDVVLVTPKLGETFSLETQLPQTHWWLDLKD